MCHEKPWYVPSEFMDSPQTGRGLPGDVWALGVVMLYLRRRLRIPDKSTDWLIWEVASKRSPDAVAAMGKMSIWVAKVLPERAQLGLDSSRQPMHERASPM